MAPRFYMVWLPNGLLGRAVVLPEIEVSHLHFGVEGQVSARARATKGL